MTAEELKAIIASLREMNADTTHLEAKAATKALPKRLWETLSTFANTPGGGLLLLGVDESRGFEAVGVQNPGKVQADLASLSDQMVPSLRPHIQIHAITSTPRRCS